MFQPVVAIIRSLSFDILKSTLYNCVVACLLRRSEHQGFFEYDISILGVWVSHSVNLELWSYNIKKLRKVKEPELRKTKQKRRRAWWSCHGEAAVYCPHVGLAYCMLLHSSSWVVVCGRSVCDLVDACRDWREKEMCDNSLGENSGILGICVNCYGRILWMFCTYWCLVLLHI